MPNALYIWIFCCVTIIVGQANRPSGQVFYKNSTQFYKYQNNCPNNWRMISDDDVQKHEQELLNFFTDSIWINVTIRHTPWVIDKGLFKYNFSSEIIAQSSIRNRETLFIECCLFCSKYEWSHIGLQETKCYCLSVGELTKTNSFSDYHSTPCVHGYIPQCPKGTSNLEMALFEKDKGTYQGFEECLVAKFVNNTYLSASSTDCNSNNNAICLDKHESGSYTEGAHVSRHRTVGYCEHYKKYDVDFKTINSTITTARLKDGLYWVNNFRESYVLKPVVTRPLKTMCTIGNAVDGKIQMQTVECDKNTVYTLCTEESGYRSMSTHYNIVTVTMDTSVIHEGSVPIMIIVAAVSVLILLPITLIAIVILIRSCKQRKNTSAQGPVYATVRKEMLHKGKVINHSNYPEIPNAMSEEENIYDRSDSTLRPPRLQTDASNYDTMENLQGKVESIYHHTVSFKTSTHIIEGEESAYHHAANF